MIINKIKSKLSFKKATETSELVMQNLRFFHKASFK